MVRRIAALGTPQSITLLVDHLSKTEDAAAQHTVLTGIIEALKGRRQVTMPPEWPAAFAKLRQSRDAELQSHALALAVTFGDPEAQAEMRRRLADFSVDVAHRKAALNALIGAKDSKLVPVLHKLIGEPALRAAAIRALAVYDDPATPRLILAAYPSLTLAERRDALNTLASRPSYAKAMLDAVVAKTVPATDISADVIRQARNLRDAALNRRIAEVWGTVRDTPADRLAAIATTKKKLAALTFVTKPDISHGRALFAKTCQQCHTLFGAGGKVGPDITGANRASLDYLLENILDPRLSSRKSTRPPQ